MNAHCHCRPACLSPVLPSDAVIDTADGPVLAAHVTDAYPQESLFDVEQVAS